MVAAAAWHDALSNSNLSLSAVDNLRDRLAEWGEAMIGLLLATRFSSMAARQLGSDLAEGFAGQPEVLGLSHIFWSGFLADGYGLLEQRHRYERLVRLWSELSVGFAAYQRDVQATQPGRLGEIENLQQELQYVELLKSTYDDMEKMVQQRTLQLAQANLKLKVENSQRQKVERSLSEVNRLLAAVFDNVPFLIAYLDPQMNFKMVNRAYAEADNRESSFFPGKNHFDLYPNAENEAIFYQVVANKKPHFALAKPFEYAEKPERGTTYWDWSLVPILDDEDQVTGLILNLLDVTQRIGAMQEIHTKELMLRKQHEQLWLQSQELVLTNAQLEKEIARRTQLETELRERERNLAAAEQIAHLGNWLWDINTGREIWSDEACRLFGLSPKTKSVDHNDLLNRIHPEDRPSVVAALESALSGQAEYNIDYRIVLPEGGERIVHSQAKVIRDSTGQAIKLMGTVQDISIQKRNEERLRRSIAEKEVLLQEVHHRVKNNLQVISSMLSLQAATVSDPLWQSLLRDSQSRVQAMAFVHEQLYRSPVLDRIDLVVHIKGLVSSLTHLYDIDPELIRFETPDERSYLLTIDEALAVGLIVNELVTNVLKHAFPERHPTDTVVIGIDRENGRFVLTVRDNGIGLPADFEIRQTRSLGFTLVQVLVDQLNGTFDIDLGQGLSITVSFSTDSDED